ncbi:branched-chain amino acid transporter permease [Streptomyces sp. NPDC015125]|uniref:branched-chain amino acid transporter permease n=1 Tax=Streptomyces sp. NPDC015125 TaxID=3364938 RepID=UPI0036FEE273
MPSTGYIVSALVTVVAITFALRAVPFAFLGRLRQSHVTAFLSQHMPAGIMVILVIYLLRGVDVTTSPYGLTEATGIAVTAGLYLWRRNVLLSIFAGTAAYVLLLHLLPTAHG